MTHEELLERRRPGDQAGHAGLEEEPQCGLDGLGVDDWTMWWSANLGAAGERSVAGRVADVLGEVRRAREQAAEADGWVMDLYLLRAPDEPVSAEAER